jgi:hypothetical protein
MMTRAVFKGYSDAPQIRAVTNLRLGYWASFGFLLLFPGYLGYHYGVNVGWWEAVLGGLFGSGAMLIALAVPLAWARPVFTVRRNRGMGSWVFFLICYTLLWSFIGYMSLSEPTFSNAAVTESLGTVIIFAAMTFIGSFIPNNPKALRRVIFISIATSLFCLIHAFLTIGFPSGPLTAFSSGEEGSFATYQGIGRSLLATGLLASLAFRPVSLMSIGIMVGTAFLILALGSRSHLFVLFSSILVQLILCLFNSKTRLVGVVGLVFVYLVTLFNIGIFLQSRASEVLDLSSSSSWQGRQQANDGALRVISDHPFVGDFGYYLGNYDGYAHNILSAWTEYGLIGFVLFGTTLIYALIVSFRGLLATRASDPAWHLALHFNLAGIQLAIFFEPIMLIAIPALGWGLLMRAQNISLGSASSHKGVKTCAA